MIALASVTYDPAGWRVFRDDPADNDLGNRTGGRRVSRTATLDGGCVVYDTGYTDADRSITVSVPGPSADDLSFARHVCESCQAVRVFTPEGVFAGVPESHRVSSGTLKITILITDRLDA
jgi:hypothetical protein